MNNPLRKEREDLTTADIAGRDSKPMQTESTENRPKLIQSERKQSELGQSANAGGSSQDSAIGTPLFPESELGRLRDDWSRIQTGFVDEPRKAVEQADGLVASTM